MRFSRRGRISFPFRSRPRLFICSCINRLVPVCFFFSLGSIKLILFKRRPIVWPPRARLWSTDYCKTFEYIDKSYFSLSISSCLVRLGWRGDRSILCAQLSIVDSQWHSIVVPSVPQLYPTEGKFCACWNWNWSIFKNSQRTRNAIDQIHIFVFFHWVRHCDAAATSGGRVCVWTSAPVFTFLLRLLRILWQLLFCLDVIFSLFCFLPMLSLPRHTHTPHMRTCSTINKFEILLEAVVEFRHTPDHNEMLDFWLRQSLKRT